MRRRIWVVLGAAVLAVTLASCGEAPLPASVAPDSSASVAWSHGGLTTLNPATAATTGDVDIAQLTRARFASEREGEVTADTSFGEATISHESSTGMTVRYDLAEPQWSDGIALDAADLMLAWAAGSGAFADDSGSAFETGASGLRTSTEVPAYDEFARSIDVAFTTPVLDWQTALDVAVPAHVVGRVALGIDDPMVAKKAVIDAITQRDMAKLSRIEEAWNLGFTVDAGASPSEQLTLSSGPYVVDRITGSAEAGDQRVALEVNRAYKGAALPAYERLVLQQTTARVPADQLGDEFDVMQVEPYAADFDAVRELERDDYGRATSNRGEMWALIARVDGDASSDVLADAAARQAFLRAVPGSDIVKMAGGEWNADYVSTSSIVFPPGTDGYDIAVEDAGLAESLSGEGDANEARAAAGVRKGTSVCVLYDTDLPFAAVAYEALRVLLPESGWNAEDCGTSRPQEVVDSGGDYDVALVRVPVPIEPSALRAQWGSDSTRNVSGAKSTERDALIEKLARTTDPYAARDVRVEIEKTIVDQVVVLPLAMDPVITLFDRDIEGVAPASGTPDGLIPNAIEWAPVATESPGTGGQ